MIATNITDDKENIIQSNKCRIKRIKSFSKEYVSERLAVIRSSASEKDFTTVKNILENELFFEKIEHVKIEELIEIFRGDKDISDELLESYVRRGFKGFDFSCMPIIRDYL